LSIAAWNVWNVERRRRAPATIGLSPASGRMPCGGNTIGSNSTSRRKRCGCRFAAISRQAPPIECPKASIGAPPFFSTNHAAIASASSP
jgi:hypothetical protein